MFDKLKESKIFIPELNMEVVPYSVAENLLTQALDISPGKLEEAMSNLKESFRGLDEIVEKLDNNIDED